MMPRKRKAARYDVGRAGVGSARPPAAVPLWQDPTAQHVAFDAASMTCVVGRSSDEPDALARCPPRPIDRSRAQTRTVTALVLNVRMINTIIGVITKLGPSFCAVNGGGWLVSTVSSARHLFFLRSPNLNLNFPLSFEMRSYCQYAYYAHGSAGDRPLVLAPARYCCDYLEVANS